MYYSVVDVHHRASKGDVHRVMLDGHDVRMQNDTGLQ